MSRRRRRGRENVGVVYLLHFAEPYISRAWPGAPNGVPCPAGWQPKRRVQHYVGFTEDLEARIQAHMCGDGAKLVRVCWNAGIPFELARTWSGDRRLESRVKNYSAGRLCPRCHGERALRLGHFATEVAHA